MRQRNLGIFCVLFGGLMAASGLVGGGSGNTDTAVVFGVILVLAGVRAIVRYRRSNAASV